MILKQNRRISNAVKSYIPKESIDNTTMSFSEEFEVKMEKFIRRKQRSRNIFVYSRRTAAVAIAITFFGSWVYLMLLQRHDPDEALQGNSAPHEISAIGSIFGTTATTGAENDSNIQAVHPNPEGELIIGNTEPRVGPGAMLRKGIMSWEEARASVLFNIKEPLVLPKAANLLFLELLQLGENNSYPCAAALYQVPFKGDSIIESGGAWHLYFYQYYVGSERNIILPTEMKGVFELSNTTYEYIMSRDPYEITKINNVEVLSYEFHYTYSNGDISTFLALHWVQDDILFRIVAPVGYAHTDIISFTFDDLFAIAHSLIMND